MEIILWVILGVILLFCIVVVRGAPYVPSHQRFAKQSLKELYPLSQKDTLVDLGSGDGVILRIAAGMGARAIGYELNPLLVLITKFLSRGDKNVQVKTADYWLVGLPKETSIVYVFAVSRDMGKLETKMQQWTNESGRKIWLMTYGAKLKAREPVRSLNAHTLYLFEPETLQR